MSTEQSAVLEISNCPLAQHLLNLLRQADSLGRLPLGLAEMAVYHKRGNHNVTLYEKRVKIRYHLHGSPLG